MALTLAPPVDQPVITWGALGSSAAASTILPGSPGFYREKREGSPEVGAGVSQSSTAALDVAGSTRYRYPAVPNADNLGAAGFNYVQTTYKPGGSPQQAYWPMSVEFVTSSPNVLLRLQAPVVAPSHGRILVNGLPITDTVGSASGRTAGSGYYLLLTFPDARPRTVTILGLNNITGRFGGVAVDAGYVVEKPTDTPPRLAVIGDSYTNGAGTVGQFDTFAWRLAAALGYARGYIPGGIGGTGWIATLTGQPTSNFAGRVSAVQAFAPDAVLVIGGRNDSATGLQAAVESLLDALGPGVQRWVSTSASESTQAGVRAAIAAGAASRDVPFLDVAIDDLEKIAGDGIHPTLDGHKVLTDELLTAMAPPPPPIGEEPRLTLAPGPSGDPLTITPGGPMRLDPRAREYATWTVEDAPDTGTLEVSYDDGTTWHPLERDGSTVRVLVAGPDAPTDVPSAVVLAAGRNVALVRATDTPQIIIRNAGPIDVR